MTLFALCLKIFFARIADVSLGTVRTIYTVKGKTWIAGAIAFIEVFIWFLVAKEALNTEIQSIWIVISYAAGYATGTIIGTFISKKCINSLISVEVITKKATPKNIKQIKEDGFGISIVKTEEQNNKKILFITLNSKNLKQLLTILKNMDEQAFIVVNESKVVHNGYIK